MVNHLFGDGQLSEFLEQLKASLKIEVQGIEQNELLNMSEADFIQYLISRWSVEPIQSLELGEVSVHDTEETKIDVRNVRSRDITNRNRPTYVKGIAITIAVPFTGDPELFKYQPSGFTRPPPKAEVVQQEIHLRYEEVEHETNELERKYTRDIDVINQNLGWVKNDVDIFNESLQAFAQQVVQLRKKSLLDALNVVGSLNIPIKKRSDTPQTYAAPEIKRKLVVERPTATKDSFKPEPILVEEEYDHILSIINNMVLVMERSPKAFINMKEEDLRQHFLVQLNGHYHGQATGETFNYDGDTDILIRVEGKNIFIAECKFWNGPKGLLKTVDQLLGYTSWRDTKTAIILFNRQKDFSKVLEKIPTVISEHPCHKRNIETSDSTTFRYIFGHPDDTNRELTLTIMACDVPTA